MLRTEVTTGRRKGRDGSQGGSTWMLSKLDLRYLGTSNLSSLSSPANRKTAENSRKIEIPKPFFKINESLDASTNQLFLVALNQALVQNTYLDERSYYVHHIL